MRKHILAASLALSIATGALAQPATPPGPSTDLSKAPSGALQMDPRHTDVSFLIGRNGIVDVHGRFDKVSGAMQFDNAHPENSSVLVTIDTTSLSMLVPRLVDELKEKEAFDVVAFPEARFTSTKVTRTGPNTGTVTGDFTFKGITKPVTFQVTFNGSFGNLIGFHAITIIKRSDFNFVDVPFNHEVSDEVRINVDSQFMKPRQGLPPGPPPASP